MTATAVPIGLDAAQRTQLERLVSRARAAFEADLSAQAEARFGIHVDGTIEDEQALPDDPTVRATRRDLVEIIEHISALGESRTEAVARLLREAAFTHLNRLLAIRIAEAIGLLPESLASGRQSRGFKDLSEIMPILGDDYWGYLLLCGDELAADAPALFDPRNPLLALAPSTGALEEIVALVGDRETVQLWLGPDALGWAYQFFNTADERRFMREESAAPRSSRELAVRNQFFTPRYVVDFLVQNTLGRRLIENDPASPLISELPLLVDRPTSPGPPLDLDDTSVLDPACGSGHFLLGCYDLLERAWELQGVPPPESAPAIVGSLWGVDIDPRCAQVASAAVVLRARRHCRELALPRPNIITARSLPAASPALKADLGLTPEEDRLVERVSEVLVDAPLLGPLLKAEDAVEQEIRHAAFGGARGTLPLSEDAFVKVEANLVAHLQAVADRASSSVAERLLVAEADDALRFVDAMRRRYDAVLMNPPFGSPVAETKPYLAKAYPWISSRTHDLFCAFVGRGLELCKPDGYLGAITTRSGMFLSSFEDWRRFVFLEHKPVVVADLGHGVMEQALVEAAAYVVGADVPDRSHRVTFIRLLKDENRPEALREAITNVSAGGVEARVFREELEAFRRIPGQRLSYWFAPQLRALFATLPPLEGPGILVRRGVQTGDDFRFVRTAWEVPAHSHARTRDATHTGGRWVPLAKGGEYAPYWADLHLVVDWEFDGQYLRSYDGAIVPSPQHYFGTGLTWPRRTASGFGVRALPAGAIFSDKGPAVVVEPHIALLLLGWLNSRAAQACIDTMVAAGEEVSSGGASRSYETGIVQLLPNPLVALSFSVKAELADLVEEVCSVFAGWELYGETSRYFIAPRALTLPAQNVGLAERFRTCLGHYEDDVVRILNLTKRIEDLIEDGLGLEPQTRRFLNEEVGPHPASYGVADVSGASEFVDLYNAPTNDLIDRVVATHGGARYLANLNYFADRRIEILCHALASSPEGVIEARRNAGLLPPNALGEAATDVLSYLVGAAFGRWDIRLGRQTSLAGRPPFAPVPVCPPGMLVGADGFPAVEIPDGYPLDFPPNRLLIDEPGHPWDIELAILGAAAAAFDNPGDVVAEILQILRVPTVRAYVRKLFFKDHLSRYSRSRRKAPIYWPLTVPSKQWGVWVYAPMLSRETLFAVAREANRRLRLATEAIARLQREQEEGGTGRSARKGAEELEVEHKLLEELSHFGAEAERIAGLGWEPDLNDGILLCAAPLADVFPAWPDAKKMRAELRKGNIPWATVSRWASQL